MSALKKWLWLGTLVAIALPITVLGRQQLDERTLPLHPSRSAAAPDTAASNSFIGALSTADEAAISNTIRGQIDAFRQDNAALAFSFASPDVQERFETAENFIAIVRSEYSPVYRPQSLNFGDVAIIDGQPIQKVVLLGPAGEWTEAYYQMEQQADKTWRIAGCILVPLRGETI